MHHSTPIVLLSLLAIVGVHAHVERAGCTGAQQDGYCCNGSIFKKDDSNDISSDNLICCEGDPNVQINFGANAPTSCTAGTEMPLKSATGGGSGQSTGSSQSTDSSAASAGSATADSSSDSPASSANDAMRAMVTAAPLMGAAVALGGIVIGL